LRARPVFDYLRAEDMASRPLRTRLLALGVALVQLLGPAAATIADAQLEAGAKGPQAASHIESHRRPECARVHADDCALCQYLTTGANEPAPPPAWPIAVEARVPVLVRVLGAAPSILGAAPRTRAPPAPGLPEA
jgi:hypothetical protein